MVTGNAVGRFAEPRSRVEQSRDASFHRDSRFDDVALRRRRNFLPPRTTAACCAVLLENLDLRPVAFVYRPIERRLTLRRAHVRVGVVFEQQLERAGACRLRGDGVQNGGSPVLGSIAGVHVCAGLDPMSNQSVRLPGGGGDQNIRRWT